jgi:hypothetical protein
VRLDLRPGLLKELKIETASGTFLQPLDYEGIPFRCHRCHAYGHGVADCKLPFKSKFRGTLDAGTCIDHDRVVSGIGVNEGTQAVISQDADSGRVSRRQSSSPVGPSSLDRDPTYAKVQKSSLQACPRSLLVSGKQQFSLPLVASSVFDLALPSGSLGKTSTSSLGLPCPFFLPRPVSAFFSLSPPGALFPSTLSTPVVISEKVTSVFCSSGDSMTPVTDCLGGSTSAFVSLPLETVSPFPSPPRYFCGTPSFSNLHSSSSTQSPEGSRICYTLRNRDVFSEAPSGGAVEDPLGSGLGSLPRALSSSRGRGRHSHFLRAQDRAKLDVASGRKSSIEWVLREKQPQELVTS